MGRRIAVSFILGVLTLWLTGCQSAPTDTLTFYGPTQQTIERGQFIPGTDLRFVGESKDGVTVMIGDQAASKRIGDSLDYHGRPAPGVELTVSQRLLSTSSQQISCVGTVKVDIEHPQPAEADFPSSAKQVYTLGVARTVQRGQLIPGTQITFLGSTAEGVKLGNVSGYPYRKFGDSITWHGRLRPNVFVDQTLRVLVFNNDMLTVTGLARLAVGQE
jgi:hypothetical protein